MPQFTNFIVISCALLTLSGCQSHDLNNSFASEREGTPDELAAALRDTGPKAIRARDEYLKEFTSHTFAVLLLEAQSSLDDRRWQIAGAEFSGIKSSLEATTARLARLDAQFGSIGGFWEARGISLISRMSSEAIERDVERVALALATPSQAKARGPLGLDDLDYNPDLPAKSAIPGASLGFGSVLAGAAVSAAGAPLTGLALASAGVLGALKICANALECQTTGKEAVTAAAIGTE